MCVYIYIYIYIYMKNDYKKKIKNTHKMAATEGRSWEIIHLPPLSFEINFFLAMLQGMSDLNSPTRDGTLTPCNGNTEP